MAVTTTGKDHPTSPGAKKAPKEPTEVKQAEAPETEVKPTEPAPEPEVWATDDKVTEGSTETKATPETIVPDPAAPANPDEPTDPMPDEAFENVQATAEERLARVVKITAARTSTIEAGINGKRYQLEVGKTYKIAPIGTPGTIPPELLDVLKNAGVEFEVNPGKG